GWRKIMPGQSQQSRHPERRLPAPFRRPPAQRAAAGPDHGRGPSLREYRFVLAYCRPAEASCSSIPALNRFTINLAAPGTPAGSWRKSDSEVYTYFPSPYSATSSAPRFGGSPGSLISSSGVYRSSKELGMYNDRS